jgi:hypothetical protein
MASHIPAVWAARAVLFRTDASKGSYSSLLADLLGSADVMELGDNFFIVCSQLSAQI